MKSKPGGGTLRIIAGKHRGRRLASPKDDAIRPTTDRIRESLFSILGNLHDVVVVDAYAGTGALGCEALSRGARRAWFFDASSDAVALVRANLAALGEEDAAIVIASKFVNSLGRLDEDVDLVFLDPPYGSAEPSAALRALAGCRYVHDGTLLVLEQDKNDVVPDDEAFELDDQRLYGTTRLSIFRRRI